MAHSNSQSADAEMFLEIDGEDVEPSTVDARSTLELASAYFDLLSRVAQQRGEPLALRGLRIIDKCVALATTPASIEAARKAASEIDDYLAGRGDPAGVHGALRRLRDARRMLPEGLFAQVNIGSWRKPLLPPTNDSRTQSFSTISLRARPIRAGGVKPKVRFTSDSEDDEFILDATEQQVREIGPYLYKDIDISATVWRDEEGLIRGGRLDELFVIDESDADPRELLRAWLQENAPQWANVADIEAELKRD